MRRSRIYCDSTIQPNQSLLMDERNNHYLLHVLRVKVGQALIIFDGSGDDFQSTVEAVTRKSVTVAVSDTIDRSQIAKESPLQTTLAIAISKGERMDWVMQKATELGVSAIQPLITQRVDVKLNQERMNKRVEHWHGVVIGACEQSGRSTLPVLHTPLGIDQWLDQQTSQPDHLKLVLRANGENFSEIATAVTLTPKHASVLIGPEGGLSEAEIAQAEQVGFIASGFGARILRTETAPIVALSLLQSQWGDF